MTVVKSKLAARDGESDERFEPPKLYFWFKGETVLDHLENRYDEPHEAVAPLIPGVLESLGASYGGSADWEQSAGCGCGCSPGFVLRGSAAPGAPHGFDVYLDVAVEAVAAG